MLRNESKETCVRTNSIWPTVPLRIPVHAKGHLIVEILLIRVGEGLKSREL